MDINEMIERIKDILATNEITTPKDSDVARAIGINPNTLAQAKFKNRIPYKAIMDFLHNRGISINTFFYGDDPHKIAIQTNQYKILKLYTANASAGGGCFNDIVYSKEIIFDKKILSHLNISNCEIIIALGDSMENVIFNNSLCLISRSETIIKNGKIYAVNTRDGLFIKQCFINKNHIILKSLNSIYQDSKYCLNEVNIDGKLKGVINKL